MNVAIIGSNGFLGSELTHAAKKVSNYKIYSVIRSSFIDFVNAVVVLCMFYRKYTGICIEYIGI